MASVDHSQFQFAAERYVLGELSEQEELAFEEHFFSCGPCAREVEDLLAIRDAAPAVLPGLVADQEKHERATQGWRIFSWLPPFVGEGTVAALLLTVAYQNAFQIPRMRTESSETLEIQQVRPWRAVRGGVRTVFPAGQKTGSLLIAHEWPEKYNAYRAEIKGSSLSQSLVASGSDGATDGFVISIPTAKLGVGTFELVFSGKNQGDPDKVVARCPFTIEGMR